MITKYPTLKPTAIRKFSESEAFDFDRQPQFETLKITVNPLEISKRKFELLVLRTHAIATHTPQLGGFVLRFKKTAHTELFIELYNEWKNHNANGHN